VSDPDHDLVGSGIICRLRIRNSNFGSGSGKDPEFDYFLTQNCVLNDDVYYKENGINCQVVII